MNSELNPDEFITTEVDGKTWFKFACTYKHKGREQAFSIYAEDWDDAKARLASISFNGKIEGVLAAEVPANEITIGPIGLWIELQRWWRNWRERRNES